jgi:very-short-patch-repair endonuclease
LWAAVDRNEPGVAVLAKRQRGLITREPLVALGFSDRTVARAVAAARLHRVHRGVYLVGHAVMLPFATEHAALLAIGDGATLGAHSAGHVNGIAEPDDTVHVIAAHRRPRNRPGITTHHAPLPPQDVRSCRGLRLTSPERTLRDLATFLAPAALERATNEARVRGLIPRGTTRPPMTRSEAERRLLTLLRKGGLSPTHTNVTLHGHEVDILYAEQRLVVEVDGLAFQDTVQAAERDRRRDTALLAAGYRVLRVTWRQIAEEPERLLVQIARALADHR